MPLGGKSQCALGAGNFCLRIVAHKGMVFQWLAMVSAITGPCHLEDQHLQGSAIAPPDVRLGRETICICKGLEAAGDATHILHPRGTGRYRSVGCPLPYTLSAISN